MSRAARCGLCKQNFGSAQAAVDHAYSHTPRKKKASDDPIWRVRYDRNGGIAEVVSGPRPDPKVGSQIERGEGAKPGVDASENGPGVSGDGHVSLGWWNTPCLCSCHFGKPACDTKGCS